MENNNDPAGFDFETTKNWVTGIVQDPEGTARAYRDTGAPWKATFMHITLPVYAAAFIGSLLLGWLFGGSVMMAAPANAPVYALVSAAWMLGWVFVVAFIFDYFAGVFEGQRNFDAAFAALSLAAIPGALGSILGPLPWIGWLISLAAGIYTLVLAYRFVPIFLNVPDARRVVHFVVSLLVAFVVNLVVSGILASAFAPDLTETYSPSSSVETGSDSGGGMFGQFEDQANLAEQARADRYEPPADGRLTEEQVATYARNMERTAELRERLSGSFESAGDEEMSFGDLLSGAGNAARMGTAEMEVVKGAGGNWAEHRWVRRQLETARVQKDGSPAVEHNYALFEQYRDQIEQNDG
ncbi:MAG: Yip1 family protein [Pseudomonadota bacterium]